MNKTKEFRVTWCQRPWNDHVVKVLFVEAVNPEDAKQIVKNHIERKHGIANFNVFEPTEPQPTPAGRVID